ncbi:hypothetical protein VT50_0227555 [Streptomyces antioxidans]|uniref:Uncharacterized protein n=2 Tax=Streptomyces TaxID=1883 RepID=A0A1V4CZD3_9ACTN|nr:hypothetical protein VT50_0227555 [Streptomyces antioxidans]
MSWDVHVARLPEGIASIDDLPDDYQSPPIRSLGYVRETIRRVMPDVDLSNPPWGILNGPTWSIELLVGRDDPVGSLLLEVRGSGDDVMEPIFLLAEAFGCEVYDTAQGAFLAGRQDTDGWRLFQRSRDWAANQF